MKPQYQQHQHQQLATLPIKSSPIVPITSLAVLALWIILSRVVVTKLVTAVSTATALGLPSLFSLIPF
ncbi:hypothetical protein BHY_1543 (plasmid) [Borrelia nietonii YOR]|uniref:Uncharacterized protein n=2 Tax=Borrelia TaxID=138 RepID=W5SCV6_9SPIR|nr:hypothetical protein [Borrelia nietonii]AHH04493.1 hypothetical protein BHY_1543 [Borrelia nietonii YOR]AHH14771.1 hypothetical protein BHW_0128000 [Borrelia hermsii MTW]